MKLEKLEIHDFRARGYPALLWFLWFLWFPGFPAPGPPPSGGRPSTLPVLNDNQAPLPYLRYLPLTAGFVKG